MGAVRHRQLIQLLATFVALDMAVGVVALSARRGGRDRVQRAFMAGSVMVPLSDETGTGILAGANLNEWRGSKDVARATDSLEAAPTTGSSVTTASTAPITTVTAATSPPLPSTSTTVAPAPTTITTRRSAATTAPTRSPGMTVTPKPAPGSATTATTRSSPTTARSGPTTITSRPPAAAPSRGEVTVTDPAGDTFVDMAEEKITEPRADVVRATAYWTRFIALVMQVQQPVDPRTDERWAADATFANWSVDTTGDGRPEFDIQYSILGGELGGVVSPYNSTEELCAVESAYGPDGYTAIVDPACLGNPASFTFQLTMRYDTNPKDDAAPVASDVTPNGGMSFPVSRPS